MSYNALCVAVDLGIKRVSLASSVNSIGMRKSQLRQSSADQSVFSQRPKYDYFPLDEKHPFRPEDPYSLSK
jgi:nucleoside-diphosphate-sugar epimerase